MTALGTFSLRSIKGNYFDALQERQAASWASDIAQMTMTDQIHEIYKWLGAAPAPQTFKGERQRKSLRDFDLTVISDKYEATMTFDVSDWNRDKTGQALLRVREMGMKAATLPQRLLTTAIIANGTSYDGSAFFATSHAHGGTVDNALVAGTVPALNVTTAAAPTPAEFEAALMGVIQAMMAYTDSSGDPCNEFATSFLVMVPTNMMRAAVGALGMQLIGQGETNVITVSGLTFKLVVNPRLTSTTQFYVSIMDGPVRPAIWQDENIGSEEFKTLGLDSDGSFWRDEIAFGAKRITGVALGRFEYMARATLS